MNHRTLEMRLQELELKQAHLEKGIDEAKASGADKEVIGKLVMEYVDISARKSEILQWQEETAKDPKYGSHMRINGMWHPKLPMFGSVEKALEAMHSPAGWFPNADAVKAAREFNARTDVQGMLRALDGRSPLLPEEERKPFNTTI